MNFVPNFFPKISHRHYKNKREQKPGWNRHIIEWCLKDAKEKKLKPQDYWGGLVLDEMKIEASGHKGQFLQKQ